MIMINNYNEFLNEKLSDKLSGFNDDELYNQFLNGDITIEKYFKICKDNNVIINLDKLKEKFLNGDIDVITYTNMCKYYKHELPTKDEIHTVIKNQKNYELMFIYACEYDFLDLIKIAIDNGAIVTNFVVKQLIKKDKKEVVNCIINNGFKITHNTMIDTRNSNNDTRNLVVKYYEQQIGFDRIKDKQKFLNGDYDLEEYLNICYDLNIDVPQEEIYQAISNMKNYIDMLYFSIMYNYLDLVKIAFSKCDDNIFNKISIGSAVKDALIRDHIDIIKYLLSVGLKINDEQLKYISSIEMEKIIQNYDK